MKIGEIKLRQFYIANNLHEVLKKTRQEPGLPLEKIADIMLDTLSKEEIDAINKHIIERVNDGVFIKKKIPVDEF